MTKKADDGGKAEVLKLVRQLLKQERPFTIGLQNVPDRTAGLKALDAARMDADAVWTECKQWAYVPGVGMVCIEY